ncbi:STAS domain-containing protein [Modestobacter sp. DSM 44400]|uniref:STAS domain-containing protein n=1 Tax=Modestobacter sp. DSM 44400 TaxID=1550230 RepID=UPI00089D131C|nr:STAS domain-containing protein [Modestobacter sp. DSM 44400]SDX90218.1 STAS domain-containing protein [Modestobacter sp. DSM 44400]
MTSIHTRRPSTESALTEVVNGVTGTVTASGQLTPQGADLLRGTVEGLCRMGHSTVLLDLEHVQVADADGLRVLRELCATMADHGNRLLLQHVPRDMGAGL